MARRRWPRGGRLEDAASCATSLGEDMLPRTPLLTRAQLLGVLAVQRRNVGPEMAMRSTHRLPARGRQALRRSELIPAHVTYPTLRSTHLLARSPPLPFSPLWKSLGEPLDRLEGFWAEWAEIWGARRGSMGKSVSSMVLILVV